MNFLLFLLVFSFVGWMFSIYVRNIVIPVMDDFEKFGDTKLEK